MALQGFIMPSINGVLNFKDFSNQLANSNAGNKEAVNIFLDQLNRAKDRSFKKEEGEIDRGWRADENQIERNWREAQEKKRQDWEEGRDNWRWNMENEKKNALLKANLDYASDMAYDPTNKGSIIQAQNNLKKAIFDAKSTLSNEQLSPYFDKLATLDKNLSDIEEAAKVKAAEDEFAKERENNIKDVKYMIDNFNFEGAREKVNALLKENKLSANDADTLETYWTEKLSAYKAAQRARNKANRDNTEPLLNF